MRVPSYTIARRKLPLAVIANRKSLNYLRNIYTTIIAIINAWYYVCESESLRLPDVPILLIIRFFQPLLSENFRDNCSKYYFIIPVL